MKRAKLARMRSNKLNNSKQMTQRFKTSTLSLRWLQMARLLRKHLKRSRISLSKCNNLLRKKTKREWKPFKLSQRQKKKKKWRDRLLLIWRPEKCLRRSTRTWWLKTSKRRDLMAELKACRFWLTSKPNRTTPSTSTRAQVKCRACSIRWPRTRRKKENRTWPDSLNRISSIERFQSKLPLLKQARRQFCKMISPSLYSHICWPIKCLIIQLPLNELSILGLEIA